VSIHVAHAITVTSICEGYWSDSETWDNGVPAPADSVIINHHVRLDVSVYMSLPGTIYIDSND